MKIDITDESVEYPIQYRWNLALAVVHLLTQAGIPKSLSHSMNKFPEN